MSESHQHDELPETIVHEYDGILEADHHLPRWWLGIFFGTAAFAVGYWMIYESWGFAATPLEEYEEALAAAAEEGGVEVDDALLEQLASNDAVVSAGREAFATNCVACHGARAEGAIGPNLTDGAWLHGAAPTDIHRTITEGYTPRGMPAWGSVLGARQVQALTAYVLTLRDTHVPGRAPEGTPAGESPTAPPPADAPAAEPSAPGETAALDAPSSTLARTYGATP